MALTTLKTILLFEPQTGGHRAEYLRYIAEAAPAIVGDGARLVFAVHPRIQSELKDAAGNSEWIALPVTGEGPVHAFEQAALLRRLIAQHRPDRVWLADVTKIEWALCFRRLPAPLSYLLFVQYPEGLSSGDQPQHALAKHMKFAWKEWKTGRVLSRQDVRHVFLLNGAYSAAYLRRRFAGRAMAFCPIPDPVPPFNPDRAFHLRSTYAIEKHRKVLLFFGEVSRRKGADNLWTALQRVTPETAARSFFLVAGVARERERPGLKRLFAEARASRPDLAMAWDDRFIPYGQAAAMIGQADILLLPYRRADYSSGVLARAAGAGIPVLGPDEGLLGRLIREHGLGIGSARDPKRLAATLDRVVAEGCPTDPDARRAFVEASTPARFAQAILSRLIEP